MLRESRVATTFSGWSRSAEGMLSDWKTAARDNAVGDSEAFDELGLKNVAAEGVGAWFEDGPEALARVGLAKCAEGLADGGGVVGEVVDDGDSVDDGADLEASLDALETGESFDDGGGANALADGKRGGCGGVQGVVLAGHGESELGEGLAGARQAPGGEGAFVAKVGDMPVGIWREAVALNGAEGFCDAFGYVLAGVEGDDAAAAGGRG